ncbi:Smr/MutS family protein [Pontibaca salina]|uniref:Smr/MutS family protein n=1 Tax=Pontibaca salina TaxID=2795731 RepID=A0A934HTU5_9RHOB|nr:Smr/MutS family protein [Pontibaca salina]MBI6629484.1 Smr/MutS family protein [Pontibaca salina]
MTSRRRLTSEELDLWNRIANQAERLHPKAKAASVPAPHPKARPAKAKPRIEPVAPERVCYSPARAVPRYDLRAPLPDQLNGAPVRMDRKAHLRMKRGKTAPDARIDLHGMTLDRAHPALTGFILTAQSRGKRLVLVITGKGRRSADHGPIPTPRGILKHQVPQWLAMPPLSQAVLQVTPAHISHGGEGAYYVYLRKRK